MNQVKRGRDDKTEGGLWPDVPVATSAICFFFPLPFRACPSTHYVISRPYLYFLPLPNMTWLSCIQRWNGFFLFQFGLPGFHFHFWRVASVIDREKSWKSGGRGRKKKKKWTKIRDGPLDNSKKGGNVCGQERSEGFSPLVNADMADHSTPLVIFTAHPFPSLFGWVPPLNKRNMLWFSLPSVSCLIYRRLFSKEINK